MQTLIKLDDMQSISLTKRLARRRTASSCSASQLPPFLVMTQIMSFLKNRKTDMQSIKNTVANVVPGIYTSLHPQLFTKLVREHSISHLATVYGALEG